MPLDLHVPVDHGFRVRRWYRYEEETLCTESGEPADGEALRKLVIAAAIANPYAGAGHAPSLSRIVDPSPALGREFGRRLMLALDGRAPHSIGKSCLVGLAGEYEHGNAFITAAFADPLREVIGGGLAWIASTGKRGGPNTSIDVPLAHKDALYVRSHYDTVTVTFSDAPDPGEVLVLMAVATRGRLHARLGGLAAADIRLRDGLR